MFFFRFFNKEKLKLKRKNPKVKKNIKKGNEKEKPTVTNSKFELLYDDRSAILVTPNKPLSFV